MTPVVLFETLLLLLLAVLGLSILARRVGLPPAAAFVIGGMALAFVPGVPKLELNPDLILVLFLPPLLLAGAYFTVWRDFRANLRPILLLAVGAVLFTTYAVGAVAKYMMPGLPWAACFALGAIVSPPDAVAAKAILQRVPVPRRMVTILEGESLVNDASGLMLYRIAVAATLTGAFSWQDAALTFAWLSVGGVLVGIAIGYAVTAVLARIDDTATVILVSFLAAWGSYIGAELLHVSGVLAVVAVGLIMGWRQHEVLSAHNRVQALAVWNLVVYVMEALVFILIGLALHEIMTNLGGPGAALQSAMPFALAVTAAVIASRFVWVFPATYLPRLLIPGLRKRDPYPALAVPALIGWAGMRGVVSLAAALALPSGFPERDLIIFTTFVVIAVTVLFQGASLGPLVRWLDPAEPKLVGAVHIDGREVRARINAAALENLKSRSAAEMDPLGPYPRLIAEYCDRLRTARSDTETPAEAARAREARKDAALAALATARAELIRLHRNGEIHDETLHLIEAELDHEEISLRGARAPHDG